MVPRNTKAADHLSGDDHGLRKGELHSGALATSHTIDVRSAQAPIDNIVADDAAAVAGWSGRITRRWQQAVQRTVESFLEIGRLLIEAKAAIEHGEFEAMIESDLPFKPRTARRLMAIARDQRITKRTQESVLPASWTTLYELTKLDDDEFEARLSDGTIRPDLERSEAKAIVQEQRRRPVLKAYYERVAAGCTLADLHALAASGARFGAISADPNWHYETWSEKGQDRSAGRHYATDPLAPIKALPVPQLAAENSVLHLWCMDWLLSGALEVIEAWRFRFIKVGFVWVKPNHIGLGKWQREGAELCLFATKGHPTRLNADVRQVIEAEVREHSRKPDEIYERIERLTAGPYLELYARRPRDGWTVWGDEIPRAEFAVGLKQKTAAVIEAPIHRPVDGDNDLDIPPFLRRGDPACPFGRRVLP